MPLWQKLGTSQGEVWSQEFRSIRQTKTTPASTSSCSGLRSPRRKKEPGLCSGVGAPKAWARVRWPHLPRSPASAPTYYKRAR